MTTHGTVPVTVLSGRYKYPAHFTLREPKVTSILAVIATSLAPVCSCPSAGESHARQVIDALTLATQAPGLSEANASGRHDEGH
jgi:hypothetical protein